MSKRIQSGEIVVGLLARKGWEWKQVREIAAVRIVSRRLEAPESAPVDGEKLDLQVVAVDWGTGFQPYRSNSVELTDP